MQKAYTKSRLDGAGAVINEELFVMAHCLKKDLEYVGAYGFNTTISGHFQNHHALCNLLNLPLPTQFLPETYLLHYKEIIEEHYSPEIYPDVNQLLDTSFIELLRSRFLSKNPKPNTNKIPKVAMHIRRGDVKKGNAMRYTPNAYYLNILQKLREINPNVEITIFSQVESDEPFNDFYQLGCNLELNKDLVFTWKEMIFADVLVMSKGSFSYVPALYNSNFVIFQPAWYKKLNHWHDINDANLWQILKLLRVGKE